MIPVALQPEPADFDARVRQPGLIWLSSKDKAARKTIRRLKLNSPEHNEMRAKHFIRYLRKKDEESLKELSPFVWYETQRQGLL